MVSVIRVYASHKWQRKNNNFFSVQIDASNHIFFTFFQLFLHLFKGLGF